MNALAQAALRFRVPVFPCGADKAPLVPRGFKAASRDPQQIAEWFANPRAEMIGVPTGAPSGLAVVDVDAHQKNNGIAWLESNRERVANTRIHRTRSGGYHIVWRMPPGEPIRNSASRIAPGVDVRGEGGYIIAPPSPGYSIENKAEPALMPAWLATLCRKPVREAAPVASYVPKETEAWHKLMRAVVTVGRAGEGARNDTLNAQSYYVASLVGDGLSEGEAISALFQAARQAGLPDHEIKATLHSAFSAGMAR